MNGDDWEAHYKELERDHNEFTKESEAIVRELEHTCELARKDVEVAVQRAKVAERGRSLEAAKVREQQLKLAELQEAHSLLGEQHIAQFTLRRELEQANDILERSERILEADIEDKDHQMVTAIEEAAFLRVELSDSDKFVKMLLKHFEDIKAIGSLDLGHSRRRGLTVDTSGQSPVIDKEQRHIHVQKMLTVMEGFVKTKEQETKERKVVQQALTDIQDDLRKDLSVAREREKQAIMKKKRRPRIRRSSESSLPRFEVFDQPAPPPGSVTMLERTSIAAGATKRFKEAVQSYRLRCAPLRSMQRTAKARRSSSISFPVKSTQHVQPPRWISEELQKNMLRPATTTTTLAKMKKIMSTEASTYQPACLTNDDDYNEDYSLGLRRSVSTPGGAPMSLSVSTLVTSSGLLFSPRHAKRHLGPSSFSTPSTSSTASGSSKPPPLALPQPAKDDGDDDDDSSDSDGTYDDVDSDSHSGVRVWVRTDEDDELTRNPRSIDRATQTIQFDPQPEADRDSGIGIVMGPKCRDSNCRSKRTERPRKRPQRACCCFFCACLARCFGCTQDVALLDDADSEDFEQHELRRLRPNPSPYKPPTVR